MRNVLVLLPVAMFACAAAFAQTVPLDAPDRFAFGGPADGSIRVYDRATGKLVAKTDELLMEIYVLPEAERTIAYVVLAGGSEDSWSFSVKRVRGADITDLFYVRDAADRTFDVHDLNADGQLDFTFHTSMDDDMDAEFGLVASRDYVSGDAGYREEIPSCGSPRNALARQRLTYAIERNARQSRPDARAAAFFEAEVLRLTRDCPAR